ncbi:MAG: hypothetical protein AAFV54_17195, partial [Pseudomonadota bacterium]
MDLVIRIIFFTIIFWILQALLKPLLSRKRSAQDFEKALQKSNQLKHIRARLTESGGLPENRLNVLYIRRFPQKESGGRTITTSIDLIQSDRLRDLTCRLFCLSDINFRLSEANEVNLQRKIGIR